MILKPILPIAIILVSNLIALSSCELTERQRPFDLWYAIILWTKYYIYQWDIPTYVACGLSRNKYFHVHVGTLYGHGPVFPTQLTVLPAKDRLMTMPRVLGRSEFRQASVSSIVGHMELSGRILPLK
jgi:hypothetical protein